MGVEERPNAGEQSKRQRLKRIYEAVNDVSEPGDVVFLVSERPEQHSLATLKQLYRRWQGFADEDNTQWHTAMHSKSEKESRGSTVRPYIIHSDMDGVEEIYIPPEYFTSERSVEGEVLERGRIEIIKSPEVSPDERKELVAFMRDQLDKPFAGLDWKHDVLTYAFGLPAGKLDPEKASCHGIVFDAYAHIGFTFAHHLEDAPFFNIGRHLGHPLGEDPHKVDLSRLYLRDHHLYRDPRFLCVLSVFEDDGTGEIKITEHPGKYSWNPDLQKKYGV